MILHTERMSLRPLEATDAPAIHRMMNDAEVMAYWNSARIEDPAMTEEIVARQLAEAAEGRAFLWTMERDADGAVLGVCDLSDLDPRHARAEIGFIVARAVWGDGYAHEALHALIGHAAQALRLSGSRRASTLGAASAPCSCSSGWASNARG